MRMAIYTYRALIARAFFRITYGFFGGLCAGVMCVFCWRVMCNTMCAHLAGYVRYYVQVMCKGCAHNSHRITGERT